MNVSWCPWFHITCKINKKYSSLLFTLCCQPSHYQFNQLLTKAVYQTVKNGCESCDRQGTADWYYKCCRNSDKAFFYPAVKRILVHLQCCTSCPILIHKKRCMIQSIPRLITVNTIRRTVENFVDVPSYRVVLNWRLFKTIAIYTLRS